VKSFTIIEMLVVIAVLAIIISIGVYISVKMKRNASVVAGGAEIRNKIIDAVGRGAIRKQKDLDFYHKRLQEQMEQRFKAK